MLAASLLIAAVIGADIAIVAVKRCSRHALSINTGLFSAAYIVIGAVAVLIALAPDNRGMETAFLRVAGVGGTSVSIIAADGFTSLTEPVYTDVAGGTYTAVFTGRGVI